MSRTTCLPLSLPLTLVLAACAGEGPPLTSAGETTTESSTDPTTTSTSQPTDTMTTLTTTAGMTDPTTTEPTTTTTTGPSTTETTTIEPPECTAEDGAVDDACDAATPYCVAGSCVDCEGANGDASCAGVNPNTPVCSEGTCVQCTSNSAALCGGNTPVCDDASNTCVPCTEHAQCGETACNMVEGSCFPPEYVIWVDKAAESCPDGDGSQGAPFCTVAEAFAKIAEPDNLPASWTVRIAEGTYTESEHITPFGSTIAIIADGEVSLRSSMPGAAGLSTGENSTLYLGGLTLSLSMTHGLKCMVATVHASDCDFLNNSRHGIEALDCSIHYRRALISQNSRGGIAAYGEGLTHLENSYVTANGNIAAEFGGIRSTQSNKLEVVYSTVIGNDGGDVASIQCLEDAAPGIIRNSVVIGRTNNPSIDCPTAMISYSAVDGGEEQGDGNLLAAESNLKEWFDSMGGIFRVKPLVDEMPSPLAEIAMWMTGDVAFDYDGDPRGAFDGEFGFPGADVPSP